MSNISFISYLDFERRKRQEPVSTDMGDCEMVMCAFFKSTNIRVKQLPDCGNYVIKTSSCHSQSSFEGRCLQRISIALEGIRFTTELGVVLAMLDCVIKQKELEQVEVLELLEENHWGAPL